MLFISLHKINIIRLLTAKILAKSVMNFKSQAKT